MKSGLFIYVQFCCEELVEGQACGVTSYRGRLREWLESKLHTINLCRGVGNKRGKACRFDWEFCAAICSGLLQSRGAHEGGEGRTVDQADAFHGGAGDPLEVRRAGNSRWSWILIPPMVRACTRRMHHHRGFVTTFFPS